MPTIGAIYLLDMKMVMLALALAFGLKFSAVGEVSPPFGVINMNIEAIGKAVLSYQKIYEKRYNELLDEYPFHLFVEEINYYGSCLKMLNTIIKESQED